MARWAAQTELGAVATMMLAGAVGTQPGLGRVQAVYCHRVHLTVGLLKDPGPWSLSPHIQLPPKQRQMQHLRVLADS